MLCRIYRPKGCCLMTNKEKMRIVQLWGYHFVYLIDQDGDIEEVHKIVGSQLIHDFSECDGTVDRRIDFGYQRVYHRILFNMIGWGMVKRDDTI